jgi:hypothetical protein
MYLNQTANYNSDIRERTHQIVKEHVNKILFIIFFLLLYEGAIRKWIFPELSKPLFFVKDMFIFYLYIYLILKNKLPTNSWMSLAWFFSFVLMVLVALQILFNQLPFPVGIYGWRNYIFYIPMSFIIQQYMDVKSLKNIGMLFFYSSIVIVVIAFFQYRSPANAYINKNVGTDNFTEIFTVWEGVVRPSATFAFTTGFVLFINAYIVFLVFNFFLKKDKFLNNTKFIIALFVLITCIALSGSRGAYISTAIQLSGLILSSLFLIKKKSGFSIILYSIIGVTIFVLMFNFVFTRQRDLILKRQEIASQAEGSIWNRISEIIINPEALMQANLTNIGTGLGLGSGGGAYLATGVTEFALSETEWGRVIMEAGVVMGVAYILFRIGLTVSLFLGSIRALMASYNPTALVAFLYIAVNLLVGSTTGNGMTYSFTWLFLGVSLAINKNLMSQSTSQE